MKYINIVFPDKSSLFDRDVNLRLEIGLEVACSGCGKIVDPENRFCPMCGKVLVKRKTRMTVADILDVLNRAVSRTSKYARPSTDPADKAPSARPKSLPEWASRTEERCIMGKTCQEASGCPFLEGRTCRGVVFPTYPPQYDDCRFLGQMNRKNLVPGEREILKDPDRTKTFDSSLQTFDGSFHSYKNLANADSAGKRKEDF